MLSFNLKQHAHKRLNILTVERILVLTHRTKPLWQGKIETVNNIQRPQYDASCYLGPGNNRSDGTVNADYKKPLAFTNDFAALLEDAPHGNYNEQDLLLAESEKGICRVIFFSPRHDLTLPQMEQEDIVNVIELWKQEFKTLAANFWIKYIQIFKKR